MRDELTTSSVLGLSALLLLGCGLLGCSSDSPADPIGASGASGSGGQAGSGNAAGGGAGGSSHGGSNGAAGSATSQAGSSSGGKPSGGAGSGSGGGSTGGMAPSADCSDPGLDWKTANKTWYESYPDPGSEECIKYNGCTWAGQFSACDDKKPEAWVSAHNIVSAFPDFDALNLHDLCLRSGNKTLVVTVLDTCGDDDCDGCCTQNKGDADELIDIESYTNDRWGVDDGRIEWADLGPTRGDGCN